MRFLILTFYFRPDLSAGSFRISALVDSLVQRGGPDLTVDVLTTLPQRYASFHVEAPATEALPGVTIRRFGLRQHRGGFASQSLAFASFARQVLATVGAEPYDVVFASSSRLMTAVLGAVVARRSDARLYLDLRDVFSDTIAELMPKPLATLARSMARRMEAHAIRRATRVNLVSGGFLDDFRARYPTQTFRSIPNGIDDVFVAAAPAAPQASPRQNGPNTIRVLYAGNIGDGQGLDVIVPAVAKRLGSRIHFEIIGDGGRRLALQQAVARNGLTNVEIRPPMRRDDLVVAYRGADVLFLHLNSYAAFRSVLPSKLFEYAAMGKPILAGVAGYPASFIRSNLTNAQTFEPCDADGAVAALAMLSLSDAPRPEFVASFARANLSAQLADDILTIGSAPSGRGLRYG